ncbi:uncharacterized protein LOC120084065 [Benincasa hispida]|uniref:uncharacterized protein LOC120084065 n=1 Tax=Benincasa hispida TaxID=102211 RepID=UPI001902B1F6|nr:uncharacterized protein LOC120084065 [Benincasa hispida]
MDISSAGEELVGRRIKGLVAPGQDVRGRIALALRLLLAVFSSKISSDVNHPFGDEFPAARKASEEVGAQIVLGDRPIEITESDGNGSSLQLYEKLNFLSYLAWSLKRSKAVQEQGHMKVERFKKNILKRGCA